MATLEDFENALKEVVGAKRLSASKMNKLTEIAMKSLEDDTKLVAILYRTHNSLPSSTKVSSLYAFDVLARAAQSLLNKHGVTGDVHSEKDNAATFLLKIEGVLDGLFRDMVSLGNPEAKEKTKKVLDIWVKSNTFPPAVLTRLRDILSDVRKEIAVNPTTLTEPRAASEVPATTPQLGPYIPNTGPDVQATLLALLGQAAQGHGQPPSQTPPNTDPQLQQSQVALLQKLAELANGSTPPPGQTPPPPDLNPPLTAIPAPEPSYTSSRPPPPQTGRFDAPGDARSARSGYPDRGRDFRDERHPRGARGGYRGRGRWDDHHNVDRFRHRDRDWNPPSRSRRSRSRSPRRHEERRNARPHSPPRRPLNDRDPRPPEQRTPPVSAHGKDEFGRDIRASSHSPSRSTSVEDTQALAPTDASVDPTAGVAPDNHIPVSDQSPLVAASTSSAQSTDAHTPSPATQPLPGLDRFDISGFDATAPASWEGLGNMWQGTYGYMPSQEELMRFVMAETMAVTGMADGGFSGAQGGQWQPGNWQGHGPGQNGGWTDGRGGGGNYQEGGEHANLAEQSDAIVLNGVEED